MVFLNGFNTIMLLDSYPSYFVVFWQDSELFLAWYNLLIRKSCLLVCKPNPLSRFAFNFFVCRFPSIFHNRLEVSTEKVFCGLSASFLKYCRPLFSVSCYILVLVPFLTSPIIISAEGLEGFLCWSWCIPYDAVARFLHLAQPRPWLFSGLSLTTISKTGNCSKFHHVVLYPIYHILGLHSIFVFRILVATTGNSSSFSFTFVSCWFQVNLMCKITPSYLTSSNFFLWVSSTGVDLEGLTLRHSSSSTSSLITL